MKRSRLLLALLLVTAATTASAQTTDTDNNREIISFGGEEYKSYGGFLIDMGLFAASTPKLPEYDLKSYQPAAKDFNKLFALPGTAIYSTSTSGYRYSSSSYYSLGSVFDSPFVTSTTLQMGSFRLKNGARINTYGNYNADGYRVVSPGTLPWERNNFHGAFEMKSANGNFGFKLEVEQGRKAPF
jgi:hypothetical protein